MEQRRLLLLLAQLVALDQGAVALLPSLPATTPPRTTTLAFTTRPPDIVRGAFINTFSKLSLPVRRKSILYASISSSLSASSAPSDNSLENAVDATTTAVVTTTTIKTIISTHLEEATLASNNNDTPTQANELDLAEQLLMQWVEDYRSSQVATAAATSGGESDGAFGADDGAHGEGGELQQDTLEIPGADVFNNVIMGLLSLPSSFPIISSESNADDSIPSANAGGVNEEALTNEIRSLLGKGKSSSSNKNNNNRILNDGNSKSERATHILDLMEEFHEPQGSIYDAIIASHGSDALDRLAHHSTTQQRSNENSNVGNEQEGEGGAKDKSNDVVERKSTPSPYYQQAWKSAKAAYELLNRSEELYRETGQLSSRLPSISSYVTMMDVWKALAVSSEELDHGEKSTSNKKRDEALEIVRNLRQRRLEVYSLNHGNDENSDELEESGRKYNIIPLWVTDSVEDVLEFASDFLREKVPSYTPNWDASNESNGDTEASRVGTWHFNQLIFDLAEHPTSFSGPLAQDLLEFMVSTVKTTSPVIAPQKKLNSKKKGVPVDENILNPNVPKPTVDTINGVLKAWMVTPGTPDSARRAEAVLAQLAIWQSEGTIWGVNPDIVSYNTCINCWKESGIVGAAERATDILTLLEDDSIEVSPDVITYASCMAAWAALGAGRRAEEILLRMYNRSREEDASSSLPKPTTRCFNAGEIFN